MSISIWLLVMFAALCAFVPRQGQAHDALQPPPQGVTLDQIHVRLSDDPAGAKIVLSERAAPATVEFAAPRERLISLYRYRRGTWERVDEESGTMGSHIFRDTVWGKGTRVGFAMGTKITFLGASNLESNTQDDIVIRSKNTAGSGQFITDFMVLSVDGTRLRLRATVSGLFDLNAHFGNSGDDGHTSLSLRGIEIPTSPPFSRDGPIIDADLYFDGISWQTRGGHPNRFALRQLP